MNNSEHVPGQPRYKRLLVVLSLSLGLASLVLGFWHSLTFLLGPSLRLDLGSINFPTERLVLVWNAYTLWGTLATIVLTVLLPREWVTKISSFFETHQTPVVAGLVLITIVSALAVRTFVLQNAPLTDDEAAYRFAAATLRSGQLAIEAPPFGGFLDRAFFIINDRVYTSYFLGWPALLAIFGLIGLEHAVPALFVGLSVIPLAQILRRFCTAPVTLGCLVVYAGSMMVAVMGATLLTHAANTFFILCFIEGALAIRASAPATVRQGMWCALTFCIAFAMRPATAVAAGLPFLCMLMATLIARPRMSGGAAAAFLAVSTVGASLYLSANAALYGGYFETGYSNYVAYMQSLGRHGYYSPDAPMVVLTNPALAFSLVQAAVDRLSYDFFGWPLPLFLTAIIAVLWERRLWLFLLSGLLLVALHATIFDFGIDSFGPVHLHEVGPLLLVLCGGGASTAFKGSWPWRTGRFGRLLGAQIVPEQFLRLMVALTCCAWIFYFPVRLHNISVMSEDIRAPIEAAEKLEGRVAVFAPFSYTGPQTSIDPLHHFVFFMPANDIHFQNRVLWFRDAGDEANARLVAELPGRRGYKLRWEKSGKRIMVPLSSVDAH